MDAAALQQGVDLAKLVESSLGPPAKRSGRWLFWRCPFHPQDHSPSLGVTRENGRWFCFACRKGGDAIGWLQALHGMTFKEACARLGAGPARSAPPAAPSAQAEKTRPGYPDALQEAWKAVVVECEKRLWQPEGERAREYLRRRGIQERALQSRFFRAGYSPGIKVSGVWVERGIVLPCFTTGRDAEIAYISYIKVRRPAGEPRYKKLAGNGASLSGLYGARWVAGADVVFLTEGELDALLLWQEAGDLVGVGTLGGAAERLNFARFGKYLLAAEHIFTAYDNDPAGEQGAEAWKQVSGRVHTARVPAGKDLTEYWQAGGDLAAWVMETIQGD